MKLLFTILILAILPTLLWADWAASTPATPIVIPADTAKPDYDVAPVAIADSCPQPAYPDSLRKAATQPPVGSAHFKVYVDEKGHVGMWKQINEDPAGLGFAAAAEKVLAHWQFHPATKANKPVGGWTEIPFTFETAAELKK